MRYFIHLAYNGLNYRGWQRQAGVTTIQEVLEESLKTIFKRRICLIGCGRTDAMVHANQYFAHIDIAESFNFDLKYRWNRALPPDISIFDVIPVEGRAHAQRDALWRTYEYHIHTYKDPFLAGYSSYYPIEDLNLPAMEEAAAILTRYTDYSAFCKSPQKNDSNICNVVSAFIVADKNKERIRFHITANRFLKAMVRITVRRLLDVGEGRISVSDFESYLAGTQKAPEVFPAYPQGLYLSKVVYPFLELPTRER